MSCFFLLPTKTLCIDGFTDKGKTMDILLGYVSVWYRIFPQEEECKCGVVSARGILILSGFSIMGWYFLIHLESKGCCLLLCPNNPPPSDIV